MLKRIRRCGACIALGLASMLSVAVAQDRPYDYGEIVNVASIKTTYGMFDEYLKFLAGPWKQEQEALKKAGLVTSYEVLVVEARKPSDPDIYLVVTYKNWAALDGLADKSEMVAKQVYGSLQQSNQKAVDRASMRTVLGSETMQVLKLK